jgi:hypothetical protein
MKPEYSSLCCERKVGIPAVMEDKQSEGILKSSTRLLSVRKSLVRSGLMEWPLPARETLVRFRSVRAIRWPLSTLVRNCSIGVVATINSKIAHSEFLCQGNRDGCYQLESRPFGVWFIDRSQTRRNDRDWPVNYFVSSRVQRRNRRDSRESTVRSLLRPERLRSWRG